MNRSRIEWTDYSWNPITGCRHDCEYCYAKRLTTRFSGDIRANKSAVSEYKTCESADGSAPLYYLEHPIRNDTDSVIAFPFGFDPTFHAYRLECPKGLKSGFKVFVGSMADIFGNWVPDEWIYRVFEACKKNPRHNYLFLTKNPVRYRQLELPDGRNFWYGTSITTVDDMWRCRALPPNRKTFTSIEPLRGDISPDEETFKDVNWIIIGAETGNQKNRVIPDKEWVNRILRVADSLNIPVFMKDSMVPLVDRMRREFPRELEKRRESDKTHERLYGSCFKCKCVKKKSNMITIIARDGRHGPSYTLGYLCRSCLGEYCREMNLSNPVENGDGG